MYNCVYLYLIYIIYNNVYIHIYIENIIFILFYSIYLNIKTMLLNHSFI